MSKFLHVILPGLALALSFAAPTSAADPASAQVYSSTDDEGERHTIIMPEERSGDINVTIYNERRPDAEIVTTQPYRVIPEARPETIPATLTPTPVLPTVLQVMTTCRWTEAEATAGVERLAALTSGWRQAFTTAWTLNATHTACYIIDGPVMASN